MLMMLLKTLLFLLQFESIVGFTFPNIYGTPQNCNVRISRRSTSLNGMKRPILDQIASTLFNLEMDRVESSSVEDDRGRVGEPMAWASDDSLANRFSEVIAGNDLGYKFKQWVADIVAGEYDQEQVEAYAKEFITKTENSGVPVVMFSFTTCPFCRGAKDYFDLEGIGYLSMELDELDGNLGNEVRAVLGRMTRRTSVPAIFVRGKAIGGLNDGTPGLMPLAESGELKVLLQ
jgi:glutaredoxin 3